MPDKINTILLITALSGLIVGAIAELVDKNKKFNKFRTPAITKGIAAGICLGIAIGVVLQNIGMGIGIGVAIGAGIGRRNQKRESHNSE